MSVWAEAHVTLDVDGKGLPAATRKAAEEAANQMDKTFTKSLTNLGRDMAEQMHANGLLSGDSFGEAMQTNVRRHTAQMQAALAKSFTVPGGMTSLRKGYGSLDLMVKDVSESLRDLTDSGELTEDQFSALGEELDNFVKSARETEAATEKMQTEQKKLAANIKDLNSALRNGDGFRAYVKYAGDSSTATRRLNDYITDLEGTGSKTGFEISKLRDRLTELNAELADGGKSAEEARLRTEALRVEQKRLSDMVKDVNRALGSKEGFESYVTYAGDADTATRRLTNSLSEMRDSGRITEFEMSRLGARVQTLAGSLLEAADSGDSYVSSTSKMISSVKESNKAHKSLWKSLSANTRQWTLIIAAIAAAAESIAVLGSAAGAGLMVLGGAAAATLIGIGSMIAVFKGLNGELAELDPAVRPAAAAFQSIGDAFGRLRQRLQVSALSDAADSFTSLRDTVDGLGPSFDVVGVSIGNMIKKFATGMAPGTRNFTNLSKLIAASGPIFEKVGDVVGTFGEGLLEAFANPRMLESIDQMLTGLGKLADGFLEFTQSGELEVWLGRAERVFASVGGLLSAMGTSLNNLVDDDAVTNLTNFLDNLTKFMPHLENMLSILGKLDIFGLISELLVGLGEALEPLAGPMEDLFEALNDIIGIAIDEWSDDLKGVAEALAPVTQALADFLADVKPEDVRKVADALLALAAAAVIIKGTKGVAGLATAITTNLGGLGTSVKGSDWKTIGTKMGKGGAASFMPALITGLISGEGGAGMTIASGALTGLSFGGLPGAMAGALIGAIVSMFTDNGAWDNGRQQINTFLTDMFGGIFTGVNWTNGADQINVGITQWLDDLWLNFQNGGAQIAGVWNGMWAGLNAAGVNGWSQITAAFGGWWGGLMGSFANGGAQIAGVWSGMWTGLQAAGANGWSQITAGVGGWWTGLTGAFANGGSQIEGAWSGVWNGLQAAGQNGWNQIKAGVGNWWSDLRGAFANGANQIEGAWNGFWSGLRGAASGAVSGIKGMVEGMIGTINKAITSLQRLNSGGSQGGGSVGTGGGGGGMASGGIVTFGARRLIGEDGPEAVVPLRRSLSRVDPAVRALSAHAQGLDYSGSSTKEVRSGHYIAAGAIQIVTPTENPYLVASMVLDRMVEQ